MADEKLPPRDEGVLSGKVGLRLVLSAGWASRHS